MRTFPGALGVGFSLALHAAALTLPFAQETAGPEPPRAVSLFLVADPAPPALLPPPSPPATEPRAACPPPPAAVAPPPAPVPVPEPIPPLPGPVAQSAEGAELCTSGPGGVQGPPPRVDGKWATGSPGKENKRGFRPRPSPVSPPRVSAGGRETRKVRRVDEPPTGAGRGTPPASRRESLNPVPPVPARAAPAADAAGLYRAGLHARIDAAKVYPPLARKRGLTGRVTLRFTVAGDGRLAAAAVARGSGAAPLDQAALAALRAAAPFPPPPEGIAALASFEVDLDFRLR